MAITSTIRCPREARYQARKGGKPYAEYCGEHIETLMGLWDKYGVNIIVREMEGAE